MGWFAISVAEATFNLLSFFVGDDNSCQRIVADSISFLAISGESPLSPATSPRQKPEGLRCFALFFR